MKKLLLLVMAVFLGSVTAHANPIIAGPEIAPQPCDTQFWRQMSARAWLEAEREIMQNQNLIFKADSVLEYVCFDQFANIAAAEGGNIFVHSSYFGAPIIQRGSTESMEMSLQNVVGNSLAEYRGATSPQNFAHQFLGGRAGLMNGGASPENNNSVFKPITAAPQGYTCKTMSNVWKMAKCANFVHNNNFNTTDGFYPFEAIKGHNGTAPVGGYADTIKDTRNFPLGLGCNSSENALNGRQESLGAAGSWRDQIDLAENIGETLYNFQSPLGETFQKVGEKLEPGRCLSNAAVPTGITVILQGHEGIDGGASHLDGVCTNPGCSYVKGSLNSAGTCSSGNVEAPI